MTSTTLNTGAPTRALFVRLGRALYGPAWQRELAHRLDVSERAVRYWVAGREVPAYVWPRLAALIESQREALSELGQEIGSRG